MACPSVEEIEEMVAFEQEQGSGTSASKYDYYNHATMECEDSFQKYEAAKDAPQQKKG